MLETPVSDNYLLIAAILGSYSYGGMAAIRRLRPHYQWLQTAFAVAWTGALSMYWIRIKMSVPFQSLLALGLGEPFPLSVGYAAFIYVVAITAILWAGLCLYLAITGSLNLRRLLRGLCLILIVVVPALISGIFLKGLRVSPLVGYLTSWLPLLFALWLSMRAQRYEERESMS
jgi:hypothetical protein